MYNRSSKPLLLPFINILNTLGSLFVLLRLFTEGVAFGSGVFVDSQPQTHSIRSNMQNVLEICQHGKSQLHFS